MKQLLKSKVFANAGWLIGGKIIQMMISLVVSVLTARYLGPSNYGIIGYVTSYTAFLSSLCNLGINGIIIKEFINNRELEGKYTFTAIVLKLISSSISIVLFMALMIALHPNDKIIINVALLLSISVIFNSFDVINYWYQSKLESKKSTIVNTIAYVIIATYRVIMLILKKDVRWFAFSNSLDIILVGLLLIWYYHKDGGQKWQFSWEIAKKILKQSYHLILSGIMVSIFAQTDKIMIGKFMTTTEVGLYTTAVTISGLWSFIPVAIIDSLRPVIMEKKKQNENMYIRRLKQLYSIIIWLSFLYGIFITMFGKLIVIILYGKEYLGAIVALKIVVWYCSFSYLGSAKNIWLISEGKQKYEKWFTLIGASTNVILNLLMIPKYGIIGAAIATLITQIVTNFVSPLLFKETRDSSKYMIEALNVKNVFDFEKYLKKQRKCD